MFNTIKNFGLVLIVSILLTSCGGTIKIQEAGRLTLVSTKNVAVGEDFVLLARNAGFDQTQMAVLQGNGKKKTKKKVAENFINLRSDYIDGAINNVVESTPGGVFMENVEVYVTTFKKSNRDSRRNNSKRRRRQQEINIGYVVSGDVYGVAGQDKQIRGYNIGTKALYKKEVGTVVTLIDDQYCLWKGDKNEKYEKVLYDELIKIGE